MVAMVVLGVALAGVFPLMVVCSRGIESMELRYTAQGNKNGNWFSPVFRPNSQAPVSREAMARGTSLPPRIPGRANSGPWPRFPDDGAAHRSSARIIDDSSNTGYPRYGTWTDTANPNAFLGNCQRHDAQSPATDTAVWTFSNVTSGRYFVLATWPAASDQATNARYVVYDGDADASPVTVAVDQTAAPNSSIYAGWTLLTTRTLQAPTRR